MESDIDTINYLNSKLLFKCIKVNRKGILLKSGSEIIKCKLSNIIKVDYDNCLYEDENCYLCGEDLTKYVYKMPVWKNYYWKTEDVCVSCRNILKLTNRWFHSSYVSNFTSLSNYIKADNSKKIHRIIKIFKRNWPKISMLPTIIYDSFGTQNSDIYKYIWRIYICSFKIIH
jgi:hypothetical protein